VARQVDTLEPSKRICIVRHFGYDLLVRREAEALQGAGFDVDVVCLGPRSKEKEKEINGVRLHHLSLRRKKGNLARYMFDYFSFFFLVAFKLTVLHLQHPFACIQVNNMPDFMVFATLIPRILGCKVTMVMYEPTPELWATKYSAPRLIRMFEVVEQLALRYADAVFAVTEQMRRTFVTRGADADKISVILNAPDSRFFQDYVPAEAKLTNEHFTLICHGAIEARYGHGTMLQAIDRVRSRIPHIRLRILGRGSYLDEFLAQTAAMKLEDYVEYVGWVPLSQMVAELCNADVGIVAQESSPYSNLVHTGKMYDFLNFNLPVLASRLKAVEAYFGDGSLYFFEPGDPESLAEGILDLYEHPDKRRALVEKSQKLYDRYKWERQKENYLSVYRTLLA